MVCPYDRCRVCCELPGDPVRCTQLLVVERREQEGFLYYDGDNTFCPFFG